MFDANDRTIAQRKVSLDCNIPLAGSAILLHVNRKVADDVSPAKAVVSLWQEGLIGLPPEKWSSLK
jgi:FKBP-type peptidyl-prolyl cis-trans isomerase 2